MIKSMNQLSLFVALLAAVWMTSIARGTNIVVTANVRTEIGMPVPNAPLEFRTSTAGDTDFAFTNAAGVATVTLTVSGEDVEISVFLYRGHDSDLSPEQQGLADSQFKVLSEEFAFQHVYSKPLSAGQTEMTFDIVAFPTVQVRGKVINAPEWANEMVQVDVRGGVWMSTFRPGEEFVVKGVHKGFPCELLFDFTGNQIHSIRLDAVQTLEDVDLGEIQLPSVVGDALLNITMENAQGKWTPNGLHPLWWGVTVIRADGQLIFGYHRKASGAIVVGTDDGRRDYNALPQVPPGTYYIAPGVMSDKLQFKLLDALRAGNHAALDAHNVPKIVAVSGQTVSLTFDAVQARDAIMAATSGP